MDVIASSFPGWAKEAGVVAMALLVAFWLGSEWARLTQDEFLIGRLLAKTAAEDRKAVVELLSPNGSSGDAETSNLDAGPESRHRPRD